MKSTLSQIEIDDQGVAWITGANMKVIEVVLHKLAYGWSPEEMHFQHPHLSLAQIHAALAYYYAHQQELDSDIARRSKGSGRDGRRISRLAPSTEAFEFQKIVACARGSTWTFTSFCHHHRLAPTDENPD